MECVAASRALASLKDPDLGKWLWKAAMLWIHISNGLRLLPTLRHTSQMLFGPLHESGSRCLLHRRKTLLHSEWSFRVCPLVLDFHPAYSRHGQRDCSLSPAFSKKFFLETLHVHLQLALSRALNTSTSTSTSFILPKTPNVFSLSLLPIPGT